MPHALSAEQQAAVSEADGPVIVLGPAGSGKSAALRERFRSLIDAGVVPGEILVLTHARAQADALRRELEALVTSPYEELVVTTFGGFCARILREAGLEAGVDPFATPVSRADRLALLLEHINEMTLARHDLRGNPSALIGSLVARIDRLKEELVSAGDYAAWAATLGGESEADRARGASEREFAQIYATHERLLADAGAFDAGDLVLHAFRLVRERPAVRARLATRFAHVLVDELQDASFAQTLLLRALIREHGQLFAVGDPAQAIHRYRGAADKSVTDLRADWPGATLVELTPSQRLPLAVARAAAAVIHTPLPPAPERTEGAVAFWRCASERAQAQAVAAEIERLISREGVAPEQVAVLVRSVRGEAQAVAAALEERAVPYRVRGAAAFFQRAEVRDLLAWLRLLTNPSDASAVVRALARAPIELRSVDIARCTQIARRRKLDMVSALSAALESPQVPPEARERIEAFLRLHRSAAAAIDTTRPDLYVHKLTERLGMRRQGLFAASTEAAERLVNLAKFGELAAAYVQRSPQATAREFARSIAAVADAGLREEEATEHHAAVGVEVMSMHAAKGREFEHVYVLGLMASRLPGPRRRGVEPIPDALVREKLPPDTKEAHVEQVRRLLGVAMTRARRNLTLAYPTRTERGAPQTPSPLAEEAREAVRGDWVDFEEELFGPAETLQSTFRILRDDLLTTVAQVGRGLGELRFDTDLDVAHAVVRHLELIKLSALMERTREGQSVYEALPVLNAALAQAATPEQREILETSALDDHLMDAEHDEGLRAKAVAARAEPSLSAFLPRRGDGLLLSASDIETYRSCPLKYKFARVFRIPQEPTMNQRFGILVHQVLERFHGLETPSASLDDMLSLLDTGWRRGGFGDSEEERQLRGKATRSLIRYHERFADETAEPVWFEKSFTFSLGGHTLRGRVDRVDRLPDGSYELIDYKTGRPKSAAQLADDVQLSLYAVGAREAWKLEAAQQAYYYVLDDEKVPVTRDASDRASIEETVVEVAEGIASQNFEPTPSWTACSMCDFRIACPAAER